jgi:hypothetical protein
MVSDQPNRLIFTKSNRDSVAAMYSGPGRVAGIVEISRRSYS